MTTVTWRDLVLVRTVQFGKNTKFYFYSTILMQNKQSRDTFLGKFWKFKYELEISPLDPFIFGMSLTQISLTRAAAGTNYPR